MKKSIITEVILSSLLLGCKENKHTNENTNRTEKINSVPKEETKKITDPSSAWVNEIKLDDGSKWQANLETTQGVAKMLDLIKSGDPKTLEDFHSLASKLNEEKNSIVKE